MNLIEHMKRAIAFSRATYGPGPRSKGVVDHIRKELAELETNPDDGIASNEWVDVVILGLDGLWRAKEAELNAGSLLLIPHTGDEIAERVVEAIVSKQNKNELRTWPDWRTASPDRAIEHVRDDE